MELHLHRSGYRPTYTIGHMTIDGRYFCDTLEDTDRGLTTSTPLSEIALRKVYGQTAIPKGRYRIQMDVESPSYKNKAKYKKLTGGYMPRLENVPGWTGVLIHAGNTDADTLGCILVGENQARGSIVNSFNTFSELYPLLKAAHARGEQIWLTID